MKVIIITGHNNDNYRRNLIENNSLITFVDDLVSSGFDRFSYDDLYLA